MQLAKDGKITLDLDEVAKAKHTTFWSEHCDLGPSLREELVTIQFGNLEPVMLPIMAPTTLVEAEPVLDVPNEDNEG